ncbi:MAG: amino acid carrier protein [Bacteroidales bacterium]|nr:amino acid carrier protein [Bacteroidales bacterium]
MNQAIEILNLIDSYLGSADWFVYLLFGTGVFFTFYLGFPQIRFFTRGWSNLFSSSKKSVGDTSKFQSLTTALSGTVGTGNIAGVALAIHLGGPAALFWMMVCAFFGMTLKFVEVTLSHRYREVAEDGSIAGGPMYYMKNRLKMPWLGAIFSLATIACCFGTGGLPQMNSMSMVLFTTFHIETWITGVVVTTLIGLAIIGGIKSIARINVALAPAMAIFYILGALSVIIYNYTQIPLALETLFLDSFNGTAATGGFLGATVSLAFNRGMNRGLFSNEAGQGSSPIVHAASKTSNPLHEGFVALLEPFIDTIVICFLTGMAILTTNTWNEKSYNVFQNADLSVVQGLYSESNPDQLAQLHKHITKENTLPLFTGDLEIKDGKLVNGDVTLINARSVAENITFSDANNQPFNGRIGVANGKVAENKARISGKSLVHSTSLSLFAFSRGFFGDWGRYIVTISLFLFAFSTAISWSYYGDRAVTYLWGTKYIIWYKILYLGGLLLASVTDTTIVWAFSAVTIVLMTFPNLIGLILLRKEVKNMVVEYKD